MRVRARATGIVMGAVVASAVVLAGSTGASAAGVGPIYVPGQPTQIMGVGQNLPPLSRQTGYTAGSSPSQAIIAYRSSGQYTADQSAVASAAQSYLTSYLSQHCAGGKSCAGRKPAAVFDIDDTLVSWYANWAAGNFVSDVQNDGNSAGPCTAPITPVISFLNYAKSKGVAVYLITGRSAANGGQAATVACLNQLGVTGYSGLVLRDAAQQSMTAQQYKSQARAQIQQSGYTIITAIGDQVSDSAGGSTTRGFLLPNPMYYIP